MDLESTKRFLDAACAVPWQRVALVGPDRGPHARNALCGNHLYIEANVPFVIAAEAVLIRASEEAFSLRVVDDRESVKRMNHGPFPPHNQPAIVDLLGPTGLSKAFLSSPKGLSMLNAAAPCTKGFSMGNIRAGLEFSFGSETLRVYPSEAIPMAICVETSNLSQRTWTPTS